VSSLEQPPRSFMDRSLGRKAVPEAFRARGWPSAARRSNEVTTYVLLNSPPDVSQQPPCIRMPSRMGLRPCLGWYRTVHSFVDGNMLRAKVTYRQEEVEVPQRPCR
jgi:hypothetical protein